MSSNSTRLKLKLPDGTDPFVRSDFTHNWSTLDTSPGTFICTRTSRPNWGTGEYGRKILETDTRRELIWTSAGWKEPTTATGGWYSTYASSGWISPNNSFDPSMGYIDTIRPCTILTVTTVTIATFHHTTGPQAFNFSTWINGVKVTIGLDGYTRWVAQADAVQLDNDYRTITSFGGITLPTPGHYPVMVKSTVGLGPQSVFIQDFNVMHFVVAPSGGNGTDL